MRAELKRAPTPSRTLWKTLHKIRILMQLSYSAESKISTSKQHLKPPVLLILHVHMPCKNAKWSDYLKTVLGYPSDAEDQRADNG